MKSFLEFLIENMAQSGYVSPQKNSNNNFIFVVDGDGNLATAHHSLYHETAFSNMYFGDRYYEEGLPIPRDRSLHASSWGRVDDGVVSLVTPEGGISSGNEDDVFARLHAITRLREHFKEIPFMIHAGAEDGREKLHSPRQHEKHLTGLLK